MIFLIEYNRRQGRIVRFERFKGSQRSKAEKSRLEIELELNRTGIEHEVVLLDAPNENALRRSHRRYFEAASEIAKSAFNGG